MSKNPRSSARDNVNGQYGGMAGHSIPEMVTESIHLRMGGYSDLWLPSTNLSSCIHPLTSCPGTISSLEVFLPRAICRGQGSKGE